MRSHRMTHFDRARAHVLTTAPQLQAHGSWGAAASHVLGCLQALAAIQLAAPTQRVIGAPPGGAPPPLPSHSGLRRAVRAADGPERGACVPQPADPEPQLPLPPQPPQPPQPPAAGHRLRKGGPCRRAGVLEHPAASRLSYRQCWARRWARREMGARHVRWRRAGGWLS